MSASYVTVGREVDGDPARLAPLAAAWWRAFVQVVQIRLGLKLEIIQARGRYEKSGGTHADGYAIDLRTWRFTHSQILALVALARECGASATWYRTKVGSGPHIHMVVDTTGINSRTAAHYQTVAVRNGRDGLGRDRLGRPGWKRPDPHPKPPRWRNVREGIAHMQTIIDKDKEKDLPLTPDDLKKIDALIAKRLKPITTALGGRVPHVDPMTGAVQSNKGTRALNTALREAAQQLAYIKTTAYRIREELGKK